MQFLYRKVIKLYINKRVNYEILFYNVDDDTTDEEINEDIMNQSITRSMNISPRCRSIPPNISSRSKSIHIIVVISTKCH